MRAVKMSCSVMILSNSSQSVIMCFASCWRYEVVAYSAPGKVDGQSWSLQDRGTKTKILSTAFVALDLYFQRQLVLSFLHFLSCKTNCIVIALGRT
jgi:hypothetical protein